MPWRDPPLTPHNVLYGGLGGDHGRRREKKRKGYRALFDHTKRAIKRGEKFEAQLKKVLAKKGSQRGSNDPTVMLLDSTRRGVASRLCNETPVAWKSSAGRTRTTRATIEHQCSRIELSPRSIPDRRIRRPDDRRPRHSGATGANRPRRRDGGMALRRVFHRAHPQPQHARGLRSGGGLGLELATVEPVHVAAWIETLTQGGTPAPMIKLRLAAVRALFDALVVGQAMPLNPAAAVRGPSHSAKVGKTPVLDAEDARRLLAAIGVSTPTGLRDRALIGLMVYSFARIGAATAMRVEDVYEKQRRLWVQLHEKGGKRHEMPCHQNLEAWLHAYIDGCELAGQPKGGLFRTIRRGTGQLSDTPLTRQDARAMVRRRAEAAGIGTRIGNHTFRATGITAYLKAGGTLERAAAMANRASTRTTQLYDRRAEEMSLDEVERIGI